jgi:Protein of unknown function (DUF2877)
VALVLPAHRVATPALERLAGGAGGTVLGAGATAAWVDLGGFVLAVTLRQVPLLPNAVALAADRGALARVRPGGAVRRSPGRVELAGLTVTWDPVRPPAWDPAVPTGDADCRAVGRRGAAILAALGVASTADPSRVGSRPDPSALVPALAAAGLATAAEPDGAAGLRVLLRAVLERDAGLAAAAADRLLGRGPGLTPEGDDLLAAVAGTLAVLGPAAGVDGEPLAALLAALTAPVAPGHGDPAAPPRPPGPGRGQADPANPDRPGGPRGSEAGPAGPARPGGPGSGEVDPARLAGPAGPGLGSSSRPAGPVQPAGPHRGESSRPAGPGGDGSGRTTALSVTLLRLAARGLLAEPAGRLLDLGPAGERDWPAALRRLERLGHGSGRAYAAGIGAAARLLAAGGGLG